MYGSLITCFADLLPNDSNQGEKHGVLRTPKGRSVQSDTNEIWMLPVKHKRAAGAGKNTTCAALFLAPENFVREVHSWISTYHLWCAMFTGYTVDCASRLQSTWEYHRNHPRSVMTYIPRKEHAKVPLSRKTPLSASTKGGPPLLMRECTA